ncbi:glycoside hydrolase family 43 protein [Marssonina coronariae]|uniref:Glycoside hydrolase family 43 protein n=1 Tax=Diplocarpon coronariae TaxID=2795749 RepID=A0A218Z450_9HELO|nr:glycoside hydrolase family 43 protein [Marssonina coronariae]
MPSARLLLLGLALCVRWSAGSIQIVPGATITAAGTNQHLQAHGGGIIQVDDVFYMIGENKLNGSAYQSLNCYSSKDLVSWTFVNEVLTLQPSGDLGPNRVVERPHVIYNEKTARYVMWMHIDSSNYGEAKAGVASCASVCGDYDYAGSVQPLGFQSRDMNLFKDTDGAGYLTTEDRKNGLRIDRLSDDFMTVNSAVYLWPGRHEASAIYKSGDTYFMFASYQSGWDPNDNEYCTATKLSGPWSAWTKFTPAGSKTFRSQTAAVVSINGVVMYMGDRWMKGNLMTSTYVWLPLDISGTTASMTNRTSWILNPRAGTWAPAPTETSAQAEDAANTLSNGAKILNCAACSGGKSVGFIGGPPGGTLTFTNVTSSMATTTTLRVQYVNGDHTQRYANVIVNGVASVMAFLPTEGGVPMSSTLTVPLRAGANTVCFEAFNGGWAPDIDQIIVPVS